MFIQKIPELGFQGATLAFFPTFSLHRFLCLLKAHRITLFRLIDNFQPSLPTFATILFTNHINLNFFKLLHIFCLIEIMEQSHQFVPFYDNCHFFDN